MNEPTPSAHVYVTAAELKQLFRERGLSPSKARGQNFLVDRNLLRALADAAGIGADDTVLEIGAATGALTRELAARAGRVVAVEIDDGLYAVARESLAPFANVEVVHADVLGDGRTLNPVVVAAIAAPEVDSFRVVGNLPYAISTALIQALLTCPLAVQSIAVVVQKEVAERLAASPGTKTYGLLSVLVQVAAQTRVLRTLPPHVFWPRPKVWSAQVCIRPLLAPDVARELIARVQPVGAALFGQRRKNAANALVHGGLADDREAALAALARAGVAADAKSDALSPGEIQRLAEELA